MKDENIDIQNRNNFRGFDFDYAKKRIRQAMEEKEYTQTDLGNAVGIEQSNISKGLSKNNFFSIDNLFRICDYLNLSMDEISGLSKKSDKTDSESLADLCSVFCRLNSITPFKTTEIEIDGIKHTAIYYEYKQVDSMLQDISKINSINDSKTIFESWEKGFREKNKDKLKKYEFYNKDEYATILLDNWRLSIGTILLARGYEWDMINKSFYGYIHGHGKEVIKLMYENIDRFIDENAFTDEEIESLRIFSELYEEKYEKE